MEVKERLYLTEDDRIVLMGDPKARWLFSAVGQSITDAAAAKYGIVDGLAPRSESEPEPDVEVAKEPAKKKRSRSGRGS